MASSLTTPDTLVTIKINQDGTSRRLKLPLRDLGINVLEFKLREQLGIAPEADAIFERYSDSAASYVVLDRDNTAVYKQLGRAAKAKQKLKLRVTVKQPVVKQEEEDQEEEKTGPKPASVEDETEDAPASKTPETTEAEESTAESSTAPPPQQEEVREPVIMETTLREALKASFAAASSPSAHPSQVLPPLRAPRPNTESPAVPQVPVVPAPAARVTRTNYAVCCNTCDRNIPEVHYHCSTCDDGDFDMCQDCLDQGQSCYSADHWLIKRFIKNGVIVNSTTERVIPKSNARPAKQQQTTEEKPSLVPGLPSLDRIIPTFTDYPYSSIRTCNCCVQEMPEVDFVHCTTCEDFDLCRPCFAKNKHGHHPKHSFVAAVEGTRLEPEVSRRLAAGRDQPHNAICDGCDVGIAGIRHKCLDCPDWDYCSECVVNSSFIHPGHRFVPIYEPLELASDVRIRAFSRPTHVGICCDGPLCSSARTSYIVGDRYKCAVCDDTDFCANCEASPANNHNKTHPLIKFRTPVRHVSVTTKGEHENGRQMPAMGDRPKSRPASTVSRATEAAPPNNLLSNIQTVVDVKPSEPTAPIKVEKIEKVEDKVEEKEAPVVKAEEQPAAVTPEKVLAISRDLVAAFVRDTVPDGTVFGPDHVFEQTWILRNEGNAPWPAGCSVKFVGGDYMGHVDPSHPAATQDLESSCESTICYSPIAPGEEFPFTVLLRTPQRTGRLVSNWRLTTGDGFKFGCRLWCDIAVEAPKPTIPVGAAPVAITEEVVEAEAEGESEKSVEQSQMIFPKLEKESPVASTHEETNEEEEYEYEDCAEDEEWAEDGTESFLTDEEYEVLDASDEEFDGGHQRK
ncbi:next to BRCA1 gene 1 protein [Echria macrotheca]|uniref:Next to BRCA1 gene 1 protein n=1 Tax=Echria macrotheca TaxID=438768 RepID=A0AAJ0BMB9_9PEZI|nr:next to BRCA1 gene 1 protein [Echria macrotheca]